MDGVAAGRERGGAVSPCSHEPAPQPLAPGEILTDGVIVDCAALPRAAGSRYTHCIHCGVPLVGARDTRRRLTIWGWRQLMGYDQYDDVWPEPDA